MKNVEEFMIIMKKQKNVRCKMNNLAGYNQVLGISSWAFNLVVGSIILLLMLFFLGVYSDRLLKIKKEYKGFCERCGKRLESSRYTIKLCQKCRMDEFDKNRTCSTIVPPSNFPSEFSTSGKRHNISLKTTPSAPSKLPTATSLNNNIKLNGGKR